VITVAAASDPEFVSTERSTVGSARADPILKKLKEVTVFDNIVPLETVPPMESYVPPCAPDLPITSFAPTVESVKRTEVLVNAADVDAFQYRFVFSALIPVPAFPPEFESKTSAWAVIAELVVGLTISNGL